MEFNPFFRKKPEELLMMDIFKEMRIQYPELLIAPQKQIQLEIDQKKVFDYEQSKFS